MAFIGASSDPNKWGFRILANLVDGGYQGKIYPVNPKKGEILGWQVYATVADIPETPDMAVIVVPPQQVSNAVKDCVARGIQAGVVITAGFAETGNEKLEQEFVDIARKGGMVLVGPNSQGIVNTEANLYPQMPPLFPKPGHLAIVSQSGNIVGTTSRHLTIRGFGCSKCISSGNEADLHTEDYIEYLANDPQTKVILSYLEGVKDGKRFIEVAREASKKKPIVILKSGDTDAGAKAAKSHTSALAGSDAVYQAMFQQTGIIRVSTIYEMLDAALAFLCYPLPRGRRVGIVAAGGGWGVLATDACAKLGLDVVTLSPETISELDSFMPVWWSRGNPVDLVAGTFGENLTRAVEVVLKSPATDGVILLGLIPAARPGRVMQSMTEADRKRAQDDMAERIIGVIDGIAEMVKRCGKPVIIGSELPAISAAFAQQLNKALADKNFWCFTMPHEAATAFALLARYAEYLNLK
ncbi:MAG: acetyl CoA synthetase [Chloroflexi bacterium]|nr:acetyl CoA synthetase [Chloroflexota bacterium]MBM3155179.1 acetyl CoA synthetase [Chloroflexota bacterium]MBM3173432.1 acetyl CoA synthetase [Chloroflexota bacterium]MBM3175592.1 acetyl CoA synthetase [Chloroflexota bacterium]MBM4452058.1 acetyl CoA synthetase [Chloroflexota bacterium]